jgi:hypothetical protein
MTPEEREAFKEAVAKVLDGMTYDPDEEMIGEIQDLLIGDEEFLALAAASAEGFIHLAGYEEAPTLEDAIAREPEDPFVVTHKDILTHVVSTIHLGMVLGSKLADLGIRVKDREAS